LRTETFSFSDFFKGPLLSGGPLFSGEPLLSGFNTKGKKLTLLSESPFISEFYEWN